MTVNPQHTETEHPPHHANKHRLEKFEMGMDVLVIAGVIVLGLAMVVGLFTASGSVAF